MTAPSLREAATMALEALEHHVEQTRPIERTWVAIEALRAALALPDAEVKAFESWADREGLNLWRADAAVNDGEIPRSKDGLCPATYYHDTTECAWRAWANKSSGAAAQPAAPQSAPVEPAKRPENCGTSFCSCIECVMSVSKYGGPELQALVMTKLAAPVERKPLTDEDFSELWQASPFDDATEETFQHGLALKGAIEAAHGIK